MNISALDAVQRLEGFDEAMSAIVREWNAPGLGVSIVAGNLPPIVKTYGYRDFESKTPIDSKTLFPIASNTKLFVAIAAGLLVEEGKLTYDGPLRDAVPTLRLFSDDLTRSVSLRDLLAHRTGITRHEALAMGSTLSFQQIFERLHLLKPVTGLREKFIYNNVMYFAVGHVIELLSGQTWNDFVRERILEPCGMADTSFSLSDLVGNERLAVPFNERRDSSELHRLNWALMDKPLRPSGGMISTLDDMSRWVATLLHDGRVDGVQVIPETVIRETSLAAMPLPNVMPEAYGWSESLNPAYGLGRQSEVYRGHLVQSHGGDARGFHSQVSVMPSEQIGVCVFSIGDHCTTLRDAVSYQVYERLLGLNLTPWSARLRELVKSAKQAASYAYKCRDKDKVEGTRPTHHMGWYAGEFRHEAYGNMSIQLREGGLRLQFRGGDLPLKHYHYDVFEAKSDDPEDDARWLINFHLGSLEHAESFDTQVAENVARFELASPPAEDDHSNAVGRYESSDGVVLEVTSRGDGSLWLSAPGQSAARLTRVERGRFAIDKSPDSALNLVDEGETGCYLESTVGSARFRYRKQ
ncbi:Beta-lactamase [Caballeronia hypogeia]|uniref:Beta-lactamase n=1 Tax=Caballeronia hypogeia TaxID=1777140 RepID=A0A158CJ91_9BURK|nr:serine hydrolase [Caballeronia hypogeia]SAK82395.1 Beta-lactamase [Caballeronia hypogeia]